MKQVKARIRHMSTGYAVEIQRAKYKHWFQLGVHHDSDVAFRRALADDRVLWQREIVETDTLF